MTTASQIVALLKLRHADDVFVPECKDGPTHDQRHARMDVWTMAKSWRHPLAVAYEIKVSRSDFLRDEKWMAYLPCCNQFYFVCPSGLIDVHETPEDAGLLWVSKTGARLYTKKKAPHRDVQIPDSVFRYILFSRAEVCRETFNATGREFWEQWLQDRRVDQEFGWKVGKTIRQVIAERISRVEAENAQLKANITKYEAIRAFLQKLDIDPDCPPDEWSIERRLERARKCVPDDIEWSINRLLDGVNQFRNELRKLNGGSGG